MLNKDLFVKYEIREMIVKNMFHDKKKLIKTGTCYKTNLKQKLLNSSELLLTL